MAKCGVDLIVVRCSNFPVASSRYWWTRRLVFHCTILFAWSIHVLFLHSQNIFLDLFRDS